MFRWPLHWQIAVGMLAGVGLGLVIAGLDADRAAVAADLCRRLGGLFLRMLTMVAVPLIVTSLASGVLGLGEPAGLGRMFSRTLIYYLATSMIAILTGLAAVNLLRPGLGTGLVAAGAQADAARPVGVVEMLFTQIESLIPANPLAALVKPDFLSIIAFTLAFSIVALRCGGRVAEGVRGAAETGFAVMMRMTSAIIRLAPVGVLFLVAHVTATQGAAMFRALGWYLLTVALGLAVHAALTLPAIVWLVARRDPWRFAWAMAPALLTAFSSASSNATLPLSLACAEERGGVRNRTASFVMPLGATINMDGTALYEAVAVLFIAQVHHGHSLPISAQVAVALTALLASVGAAGIPHAGLVMMAIILQAVGLPVESQGIILAVDRVLDMGRTAVNVWSDACGALVVDTLESGDVQAGHRARRNSMGVERRPPRHGMTLVELLVVIAISATLVGLLLPAVQSAREAARRLQCTNNLKQVGLAIAAHVDVRKAFPEGRDTRDNTGVAWSFRLLPFLEESAIHDALDRSVPDHHPSNARAMRSPVATYFCASRRGPVSDRNFDNNDTPPTPDMMGIAAGGDFAAVAGASFHYSVREGEGLDPRRAGAIFTMSNVRPQQVTDGLSKTFAVGERHLPSVAAALARNPDESMLHYSQGDTAFFAADTPHTQFRDTSRGLADGPADTSNIKFGSLHPGVSNFVFLDGHVEAISVDTERTILRWYCVIGDGNDPTHPPEDDDDDPT